MSFLLPPEIWWLILEQLGTQQWLLTTGYAVCKTWCTAITANMRHYSVKQQGRLNDTLLKRMPSLNLLDITASFTRLTEEGLQGLAYLNDLSIPTRYMARFFTVDTLNCLSGLTRLRMFGDYELPYNSINTLKSLSLSLSSVASTLLNGLSRFTALESLSLDHVAVDPLELGKLTRLNSLRLMGHCVELSKLHSLDNLTHLCITGWYKEYSFVTLTTLKSLELDICEKPEVLLPLTRLEHLKIWDRLVLSRELLSSLRSLSSLCVERLHHDYPLSSNDLPRLTSLVIGGVTVVQ